MKGGAAAHAASAPPLWLMVAALAVCAASFLAGTAVQMRSVGHAAGAADALAYHGYGYGYGYGTAGAAGGGDDEPLRVPRLHPDKVMPHTVYTSGSAGSLESVRSSHHLHIQDHGDGVAVPATCRGGGGECAAAGAGATSESAAPTPSGGDDDEEHLPAGQHLLVDIKNVDSTFLNSESRLADAMVEVVELSELTLLSYHCHALIPKGVSCVGVLLESHVSFHTWPDEGVITLDLFTCGTGLLVPVVPTIERLFGVPMAGAGEYVDHKTGKILTKKRNYVPLEEDYIPTPHMVWSHRMRGFTPVVTSGWNPLDADLGELLGILGMDYKETITSTKTPFQQVDVVDIINPLHSSGRQYERSLNTGIDTYESRHSELFLPDRLVFLDGILQSTARGDAAYHEALVHPAMFAHSGPERVAIIGGGEGATLREVLKHGTVKHAKMIEIDEGMVNASREHLPGWSDCSDVKGSEKCCFDDPRTDLLCEDALAWFIDRFGREITGEGVEEEEDDDDDDDDDDDSEEDSSDDDDDDDDDVELFDVIIMDALDPEDNVEFAKTLYNNDIFLESMYNALTDDGVLILQLGEAPGLVDAAENLTHNKNRHHVMRIVENLGFESMHVYEESHCGFSAPWNFMVACKSESCRRHWYQSEAELEVQMHQRLRPTLSGKPILDHFDPATMTLYHNPSHAWETVFCRLEPTPEFCLKYRGYKNGLTNIRAENLEVKPSTIGDGAGRGVFAKVDIPKGAYIGEEQAQTKVHFAHSPVKLMEDVVTRKPEVAEMEGGLRKLLNYMYGYGFQQNTVAKYEYYIDSGVLTFVNHGCNGTDSIGEEDEDDEWMNEETLDLEVHTEPPGATGRPSTFDIVADRHLPNMAAGYDRALRDIGAGEEIFQNYLYFISSKEDWEGDVLELKAQCRGEAIGEVKAAENDAKLKN